MRKQKLIGENGFSLIELVITVVLIGILAAVSSIIAVTVIRGIRNKTRLTRIIEYAKAQDSFRTTRGRRRFGTLTELCQEQLLPRSVADFKAGDCTSQVPIDGWVIRDDGNTSLGYLRNNYFAILVKENAVVEASENTFCTNQSTTVFRSEFGSGECTPESEVVRQ